MLQDSPMMFHAVIALVGLVLYLFVWRITGDLPAAAKYLARMALAVVMLVPIALAILFGAAAPAVEKKAEAADLVRVLA